MGNDGKCEILQPDTDCSGTEVHIDVDTGSGDRMQTGIPGAWNFGLCCAAHVDLFRARSFNMHYEHHMPLPEPSETHKAWSLSTMHATVACPELLLGHRCASMPSAADAWVTKTQMPKNPKPIVSGSHDELPELNFKRIPHPKLQIPNPRKLEAPVHPKS